MVILTCNVRLHAFGAKRSNYSYIKVKDTHWILLHCLSYRSRVQVYNTTNFIMKSISLVVFVSTLALALSYPILEDGNGDLVELIPIRRVPRSSMQPRSESHPVVVIPREEIGVYDEPIQAGSQREPITAETGHGHGHHGYDYVDYGAYTGGYGAFGWYTDHPVYTYGH